MQAEEVAYALYVVFLSIGAPLILMSDNNMVVETIERFKLVPFSDVEIDAVLTKLSELWPECTCVRGRPRHSLGNGVFPSCITFVNLLSHNIL